MQIIFTSSFFGPYGSPQTFVWTLHIFKQIHLFYTHWKCSSTFFTVNKDLIHLNLPKYQAKPFAFIHMDIANTFGAWYQALKVFIILSRYFKIVPINGPIFYFKIKCFQYKEMKWLKKNTFQTVYQVVWDFVILPLFANLSLYIIGNHWKTSKRNNKKNAQCANFFTDNSKHNLILQINQL